MTIPTAGAELGPHTFAITRADLLQYAAASGDHNPIHSDEAVARSVGLPGVIAHGMYTLALTATAVRDWFPTGEVLEFGSKFTNPVMVPADSAAEIEVTGVVKSVDDDGDCDVVALALHVTHDGTKVLGMPRATVRVPRG